MERRAFLAGTSAVLLAAPLAAEATQGDKVRQVGESQNLTLTYRDADGRYEQLPALARELVNLGVDVIVTEGTPPTRAAMQVTKTVPIVMATSGDSFSTHFVGSK